ncbi:MAG: hypothetical protein ACO3LE_09045, partial [Bdellovibrionota bacterium]
MKNVVIGFALWAILAGCGSEEVRLELGEKITGAIETYEDLNRQKKNLDNLLEKNAEEEQFVSLKEKIIREAGCEDSNDFDLNEKLLVVTTIDAV